MKNLPKNDETVLFAIKGVQNWIFGFYHAEENAWVDMTTNLRYDGDDSNRVSGEVYMWRSLPLFKMDKETVTD